MRGFIAIGPLRMKHLGWGHAIGAVALALVFGSATMITSSPAQAATVWLCKPGLKSNPCAVSMGSTALYADRTTRTDIPTSPKSPRVDCFYVYPTVSNQKTGNANLNIDPEEVAVAQAQASRFQAKCKIYAPMYRQLTRSSSILHDGTPTTPADQELPYTDVKAAWKEYLTKFNKGRGVILIGHSQGTVNLTRLVKEEIDPSSTVRRKLVSAMLIGGGVLVPTGKDVGGSFKNIPACRATTQTHCVIAYNSYLTTPPQNGQFGITLKSGMRILCVNPNSLSAGATGPALPYLPTSRLAPVLPAAGFAAPSTQWVSLPGMYSTRCKSNATHTWLQVSDIGPAGDPRPHLTQTLGPAWGMHMTDISLNLGSLVSLAGKQSAAWKP
ncbi:MAG: DUF3089 domain-containing protein [Actinobacteria bacterium]|uniref:Unannotated protein n=1 Tax=freshwater metagenome TaxID=449393 RepID=A0A6J7ET22_9ZZZZ|nr:DUF3089 domain-containing protein [Actinomycetota bacterium]